MNRVESSCRSGIASYGDGLMNNGVMRQAMDQAQALTKLWTDSIMELTGAAFSFSPGSPPPEMARQMRESFLSALGHSIDNYMRSEPFLQSMRQSIDMAMDFRKQFAQQMQTLHHSMGTPAVEDIQSVMLALRHFEERLVRRLDHLAARMDDIDDRLAAIEESEAPESDGEHESEPADGSTARSPSNGRAQASRVATRKSQSMKPKRPRSRS